MSGILKRFSYIVTALCAVAILLISAFVGGSVINAYATEPTSGGLIKELERFTIDGKPFKAEDYPVDPGGSPQLLMLYENGYPYSWDMSFYGLTLYVYNPSLLDVIDDASRNTVQMHIGKANGFSKYRLTLEDSTEDKLFIKFKVKLDDINKNKIYTYLEKDNRVYEVSSIELLTKDAINATDYPVGYKTHIYTFTGFQGGLGEDPSEGSTLAGSLSYTVEGGTDVIPLNVKHTSWSPEGSNGNSYYTRDVIHTAYFAVPNEFAKKYDYLQAVKCEWYEALLKPMYVTHNEELYKDFLELIDQNVLAVLRDERAPDDEFDFSLTGFDWMMWGQEVDMGVSTWSPEIVYGQGLAIEYVYGFYNLIPKVTNINISQLRSGIKSDINHLPLYIYLPMLMSEEELANGGSIPSSRVERAVYDANYQASMGLGGVFDTSINDRKVANKYASALFETWDEEPREVTVHLDDYKEVSLSSQKFKKTFWDNFIYGKVTQTGEEAYTGIDAIVEVKDAMVKGKTPEAISNELYISKLDAEDFKEFYLENHNDSTVYLLRFDISESYSASAFETQGKKDWQQVRSSKNTGYFFKDTCYLDFDIIEFEYVKDDKVYVVPVSMSPVDIFPEPTPPPTIVQEPLAFWKIGLIAIGALALIGIIYGVIVKIKSTADKED